MEIAKEFTFEASHVLPNHPGKCSNLHGHSWKLTVSVYGKINKDSGMVLDYSELKEKMHPIIDDLDHAHLGAWKTDKIAIDDMGTKSVKWLDPDDKDNFNPTSENLIMAIGVEMDKRKINFSRLMLQETCNTACYVEYNEVVAYRISTEGIRNVTE